MAKECEHNWRIFHDKGVLGKGVLTFYCTKCLKLTKIKKEYSL